MEEDFFTDPETGQRFTLEEAEIGLDLSPSNTIRSDEEIYNQFFDGKHREIALIKNDLLKLGYTAITSFDHTQPMLLFGKNAYFYNKAVFIKEKYAFCLLVSAKMDFKSEGVFEDKIILAYQLNQPTGHTVLWKTDLLSSINQKTSNPLTQLGKFSIMFNEANKTKTNTEIIDTLEYAQEEIAFKLADVLGSYMDYEAEIINDFIFIKDTFAARREGIQVAMKMHQQIKLTMGKFLKA